jgi:hypothetical protein
MTEEIEEQITAAELEDYQVGDAYEHLDMVRTYANPIGELSGLRKEYNLVRSGAAKLY